MSAPRGLVRGNVCSRGGSGPGMCLLRGSGLGGGGGAWWRPPGRLLLRGGGGTHPTGMHSCCMFILHFLFPGFLHSFGESQTNT